MKASPSSRKVPTQGRRLTPSKDVVEFSSDQGQQYGGIWQELHEKVSDAVSARNEAEIELQRVQHERDALLIEKEILARKFTENLSSLTQRETSNLEYRQILDEIRQEKKAMKDKVSALQSHVEWLENKNTAATAAAEESAQIVQSLCEEKQQLLSETKRLQENIAMQQAQLQEESQRLADSRVQLSHAVESVRLLKRSIAAKDTQLMGMVREKNNLQQEYEKYKRQVPPRIKQSVPPANTKSTSSIAELESPRKTSIIVRAGTMTNARRSDKNAKVKASAGQRSFSNIIAAAADEASKLDIDADAAVAITDSDVLSELHSELNPWGPPQKTSSVAEPDSTNAAPSMDSSAKERDYQATIYLLQTELEHLRKQASISQRPKRPTASNAPAAKGKRSNADARAQIRTRTCTRASAHSAVAVAVANEDAPVSAVAELLLPPPPPALLRAEDDDDQSVGSPASYESMGPTFTM